MVKFYQRYGLRGIQSVELKLSSCEFKPTERERERGDHVSHVCITLCAASFEESPTVQTGFAQVAVQLCLASKDTGRQLRKVGAARAIDAAARRHEGVPGLQAAATTAQRHLAALDEPNAPIGAAAAGQAPSSFPPKSTASKGGAPARQGSANGGLQKQSSVGRTVQRQGSAGGLQRQGSAGGLQQRQGSASGLQQRQGSRPMKTGGGEKKRRVKKKTEP